MGVQEIIAVAIVTIAGAFAAKKFIRQFTQGEGGEKCAKCELNKAFDKKKMILQKKP